MAVIEAFGFGQAGIKREDFLQVDHVIQLGREPNRVDIPKMCCVSDTHSLRR